MHAERMNFLSVIAQRTEEDADRVQLVAAQFGHQAGTGAIEQSPAMQLFHGGKDSVATGKIFVAKLFRINFLIGVPCEQLREFGLQLYNLVGIGS